MIYLDNGATSFPKPRMVREEYNRCLRSYAANAGRSAHRLSVLAAEKLWETRELLAGLFGIKEPERIVFTANCTMGLNMGLKGILQAGDDLIISSMEHNSVYRPAVALQKRGVKTLLAQADREGIVSPDAIERLITPRTRLVCMLHASNVGGGINPIAEIGAMLRQKGVLFMVDAAQTAGCVPIDVERDCIDILAFPGHKGLLGPQGTGGLYVREGLELTTVLEGGTGSESENGEQPLLLPDRLESGTVNLPGIAGLCGGVRYVSERGVSAILRHEQGLAARFIRAVTNIGGIRILGPMDVTCRVGVVSLDLRTAEPTAIAKKLDREYGIAVRAGLHCAPLAAQSLGVMENGSLRFSVGAFNTPQEMDAAAYALRRCLKNPRA